MIKRFLIIIGGLVLIMSLVTPTKSEGVKKVLKIDNGVMQLVVLK